ncbi:MAG: FYVE zinc finger domain-containing protein [archaeon]|nr:FYVE zinc finger domain-containing protein [archaeon]
MASRGRGGPDLLLIKPDWKPDESTEVCHGCLITFTWSNRRHHCRGCGEIFCDACSSHRKALPAGWGYKGPERVCDTCVLCEVEDSSASSVKTNSDGTAEFLGARFFLRDSPVFDFDRELVGCGSRGPPGKVYGISPFSFFIHLISSHPIPLFLCFLSIVTCLQLPTSLVLSNRSCFHACDTPRDGTPLLPPWSSSWWRCWCTPTLPRQTPSR